MIAAVKNFVLTHSCSHCHVILSENALFCDACNRCVEFLELRNRCRRCFTEKEIGACSRCQIHPTPFKATVCLFDAYSPIASLLKDPKTHAKTIASFLLLRMQEMHLIDQYETLFATKEMHYPSKLLAKWLQLPLETEITSSRQLVIAPNDDIEAWIESPIASSSTLLSLLHRSI